MAYKVPLPPPVPPVDIVLMSGKRQFRDATGRVVLMEDMARLVNVDARYLRRCFCPSAKMPYTLARALERRGVNMNALLKLRTDAPTSPTAVETRRAKDEARREKALRLRQHPPQR